MHGIVKKAAGISRPRVEGARESQILDAALELLAKVGYDRLTMDAVAKQAKASKATLYRRWISKSALVVDALLATTDALQVPAVDTGSLRDDLVQMSCGAGGLTTDKSTHIIAGVITALHHDPEFGAEFRARFLNPKIELSKQIFQRAQARGEIGADLDIDLLAPSLAGIILHRHFVLGIPADQESVEHVVDQIIIPAATRPGITKTENIGSK